MVRGMAHGSKVPRDDETAPRSKSSEIAGLQPAFAEYPMMLPVEDVRPQAPGTDRSNSCDHAAGPPPGFSLRQRPDRVAERNAAAPGQPEDLKAVRDMCP